MLTAMGDVMRRAYEKGWITTRDGNISVRRSGKSTLYITPSGWRKTIIHPEHIIKIKMKGSELLVPNGALPSGELEMHHKLQLLNRNKTQAIVHLHPTNIIAACFAGWDMQALSAEFPEVSRYTRVGPTVPVLPVTSPELANATFHAMTGFKNENIEFDIVAQANHGVCAIAQNPWDAYEHIERLEHICEIALKSGVRPY
ncbi:MAG TPA: class II aldolase family protein [Balneolaceae bacterium]|nr:class II aldolase family protein [Balneolaceae bacterium]|tara:strand:+ start:4977 stop:5576 length:600 start_codon:yes stop_codon:yes gene_type:complete